MIKSAHVILPGILATAGFLASQVINLPSLDEQVARSTHIVIGTVDQLVECKLPLTAPVMPEMFLKGEGIEVISLTSLNGGWCLRQVGDELVEYPIFAESPLASLPRPGVKSLFLLVCRDHSNGCKPTSTGIFPLDRPSSEEVLKRVKDLLDEQARQSNSYKAPGCQ